MAPFPVICGESARQARHRPPRPAPFPRRTQQARSERASFASGERRCPSFDLSVRTVERRIHDRGCHWRVAPRAADRGVEAWGRARHTCAPGLGSVMAPTGRLLRAAAGVNGCAPTAGSDRSVDVGRRPPSGTYVDREMRPNRVTTEGRPSWLPELGRAAKWRIATVAAAVIGVVVPLVIAGGDSTKERPAQSQQDPSAVRVHPQYLAELVRHGPFTESLPEPLRVRGIKNVEIGDPSAAARLDAIQVDVDTRAEPGRYAFALVEIYPTPAAAVKRKADRIALFKCNYGAKNVYGGCVDDYGAHGGGWTCADARGFAYAEAAISPSDNAHTPLATGTLAALLRYTDRLAKVAS